MADHETRLVIDADASKAEAELDKLDRKRKEMERPSPSERPAPAGPSAPPSAPPSPPSPPGGRAAKESGKEMGEEFSRVAAKQIGRAIAGFALHQGGALVFDAMRDPNGGNQNVDRAQGAFSGAVQYGTMGAMVGGPWGAVIGGIAGAITGLAGQLQRERQAVDAALTARQDAQYRRVVGSTVGASDAAFDELLRGKGSAEQVSMLRARREELRSGPGQFSIASLEDAISKLEARGDTDSHEHKSLTANLEMQRAREAALSDRIISAGMDAAAPELVSFADLADSFSRRGLSIGGGATMADVNHQQLAEARAHTRLLERIASMGGSNIYKTAAVERATFQ